MEAYGADEIEVEVSEEDLNAMRYVVNAFEMSPVMVAGLPSLVDAFKGTIKRKILGDQFGMGLAEINSDGTAYKMDELFASMLLATMKERFSKQGSKRAVFKEEVDLFLSQDGTKNINLLNSCLKSS